MTQADDTRRVEPSAKQARASAKQARASAKQARPRAERGWPANLLMGLACLIGLMSIVLVTAGNVAVTPTLTQSEYMLIPAVERGVTGSTGPAGNVTNLLSTNFTVTIPKRLKGQMVHIAKVDFFSDQDVFVGSANVSNVTLDGSEAFSLGPTTPGSPVIPPLKAGVISFRATLEDTAGLSVGTRIYTRVEGTAGSTNFRARSKASPTTGAS